MIKKVFELFKPFKKENSQSVEEKIDSLFDDLENETIKISLGSDLESFCEDFSMNISVFREEMKSQYGFILPPVRIKSDYGLQENELQVWVNEKCIYNEFLVPSKNYLESEIPNILQEIFDKNISEIFSNNLAEKYVNQVQKNNCWLVWNLTSRLSVVEIKAILVDLINQKKSIGNITYIFEKICEQLYLEESFLERKPHKISERLIKIL